jgi:thiosulfate/3-mercaptopyruvate sulfurtransferase
MDTAPATNPPTAARDSILVDAAWLETRLHDPAVRVVEVDVSRTAYDAWHIDEAVLWNIYADLKDENYHLVDTAAVARLLARSGIGPYTTIVFYGHAPAMGLWLMKLYGHADTRVLNCSRDTWRGEGRPVSSTPAEPEPASYPLGEPDARLRAGHETVRAVAGLRGVFSGPGLDGDGPLITYCTIGGRASTAWFILAHLLGRGNVRVYDGSWAEWAA